MADVTSRGPHPLNPNFAVSWRATAIGTVVTALGELDMETARQLVTALSAAIAFTADIFPVHVDLRGVNFLGSAGLSALIAGHQQCELAGRRLIVVAAHRAVLRPLRATDLVHVLTIVDALPQSQPERDAGAGPPLIKPVN